MLEKLARRFKGLKIDWIFFIFIIIFLAAIVLIFIFDSKVIIKNIVTSISTLVVAFGALASMYSWRRKQELERSELLNKIIDRIDFDPGVSSAYYFIAEQEDEDKDWFGNKNKLRELLKSEKIDELLDYANYICYLIDEGLLKSKEQEVTNFVLCRICASLSVRNYLLSLEKDSECFSNYTGKIIENTYSHLRNYARDHHYLTEDEIKTARTLSVNE